MTHTQTELEAALDALKNQADLWRTHRRNSFTAAPASRWAHASAATKAERKLTKLEDAAQAAGATHQQLLDAQGL